MSVVPLLLMSYLNTRSTRASLVSAAADQVQGDAALVAADLERSLGAAQHRLQALGDTLGPTLTTMDPAEQERVLYGLLRDDPRLDSLCLVDAPTGQSTCASRQEIGGSRRPDWVAGPELAALRDGHEGPVRVAAGADGRLLLHLALPIEGPDREHLPAGLVARVSLRGVLAELPILAPGRRLKPTLLIVDKQGRLVGHGDFSRMLEGPVYVDLPSVQRYLRDERAPDPLELGPYQSLDGREVLGAVAPVPSLGWVVVAELPLDAALAPLDTLALHFLYASLVIMAAVAGLSVFFALRFGRPLEELARALLRIAGGDLSPVPRWESDDEIGLVARALARLTETLRRQRTVEEAMVRADRLATLGLMTAGLAHELNNPLASVQAYAEEMEERLAEEPAQTLVESGELPRALQVIKNQAARCKQITRGLLTFARKPPEEGQVLRVQPVIENALTVLRYRLRKAGLTVAVTVDPATPPVAGEEGTLEQVLVNLLTNAIDALAGISPAPVVGPAPGEAMAAGAGQAGRAAAAPAAAPAPEVPWLAVCAGPAAGGVEIRVRDRGPGMTPKELERVWDPFYTTKPLGQGTGLGLPVCRELIQAMGGRIRLESAPAAGTEAIIWLPAAGSAGEEARTDGPGTDPDC